METNRQRSIIYIGGIIIAALLIGLLFSSISVTKNKKNLYAEKQTSEKLLSEKLSAAKEMAKLKTEFTALQQQDFQNRKLLGETNAKIAESEKRISSLSSENRNLRANRKELENLRKVRADLEIESARLASEYERLVAQNMELRNSLSEAEMKYMALEQQNEQRINSDNFLVTATRGKKAERIVIRAARAKKLNMAFEVPQNLSDAISFKLTTPSGTIINPDDKSLSWTFIENPGSYTASLSSVTGEYEISRQVMMNYIPQGKLAKGEYKIRIYSGDRNIGNCRILLR